MAGLNTQLDEQLAALAAAGRTSSQIARELGVTRNAVIGLCRRRGFQLLGKSGRQFVSNLAAQPEPKSPPICQPKAHPIPSRPLFDAGLFPIGQRVKLSQEGRVIGSRRPDRVGVISGLSTTPERSRRVKWDTAQNPELWAMQFLAPVASAPSASPSRTGKGRAPRQFSRTAPKVAPLSKKLLAAFKEPKPSGWPTVGILGLTSMTCRWPIGDDPASPDFKYCGAMKETGPYCSAHGALAYTPRGIDKARRDAAREASR